SPSQDSGTSIDKRARAPVEDESSSGSRTRPRGSVKSSRRGRDLALPDLGEVEVALVVVRRVGAAAALAGERHVEVAGLGLVAAGRLERPRLDRVGPRVARDVLRV